MAKATPNVWKAEYVLRGKAEASQTWVTDTFVAGTFADACAVAERERRRYTTAVKVKSLVAVQTLTI